MKLLSAFTAFICYVTFTNASAINRYQIRADTDLNSSSYIPTKSPFVNIFSSLSADEQNAISYFVNAQTNVTIPGGFSLGNIATLLPNKTEALLYLNGSGPQPPRYAQVSLLYTCFTREYMVGPLPVDNLTSYVMPLDYIYRGNGTQHISSCDDDTTPPDEGGSMYSPYDESQNRTGPDLPGDDKAAPLAILPDGARHYFDPSENYVSWMDFSFFTTVTTKGLALFDIRFRGDRIVYELAMQEALAHYAGINAGPANTAYLDVTYDFTPGHLVPGFDCPSYATYSSDYKFCLFEFPKDYPIQRHTGYPGYHVTKNIAFMLRAVSTIGNYDYQITYEFHLDGSIQIVVRASGYIEGTDWTNDPLDPSYGFHIRPNMSGSIHDHVLNFKIDMDIHGTANSLFKSEFVPESTTYPWSNGTVRNTMKVERSFITNENDGRINWAPNAAAAYSVVNKDKPNEYGEYPGFRIYPSIGSSIHSTIQNSSVLGNAINWATHQLYALQRKDSEPSSTYLYNDYNIQNPLVDFNDFFDGEDLQQKDLVLYFNLGMHHMPDTSDLPTTVFTNAQSGIMIRPQNYLASGAQIATRQQVDISGSQANYTEAKLPSGSLDLGATNPDLAAIFASTGDELRR